MKKRIVSIVLAVALLCAMLPIGSVASAGTQAYPVNGGNLYFDPDTGTITGCDRTITSAVIPAEIGGTAVTAIGEGAFLRCTALTSVRIPASVTEVERNPFARSQNLKKIDVDTANPKYTSHQGVLYSKGSNGALECALRCPEGFSGDYTIPDGVSTISDAFYDCKNLSSVVVPASVISVASGAFLSEGLSAVYFKGNRPMDMTPNIFSAPHEVIVYYVKGTSGWTSPTWGAYRTATWDGVTPTYPSAQFTDANQNAWYRRALDYSITRGILNGVGNNRIDPNGTTTRAMFITILWRLAGEPKARTTPQFVDLKANWYKEAVAWGAEHGYVTGTDATHFNPDGAVTREQAATFLYRFADKPSVEGASLANFPDGKQTSAFAKDALLWANATGMIDGTKRDGTVLLDPQGTATRAQVANILMRYRVKFWAIF